MKKQSKAFGFLIGKGFAENEYFQQVLKGFKENCKCKKIKLVKIYEDRFSDRKEPEPNEEYCKLIREKR